MGPKREDKPGRHGVVDEIRALTYLPGVTSRSGRR